MLTVSAMRIDPMQIVALICEKAAPEPKSETADKTNSVWMRYAGWIALGLAGAAVALTALKIVSFPIGVVVAMIFLGAGVYGVTRKEVASHAVDPDQVEEIHLGDWIEGLEKADAASLPAFANRYNLDQLVSSGAISKETASAMKQLLAIKKAATPAEALKGICSVALDESLAETIDEIQKRDQAKASELFVERWIEALQIDENPDQIIEAAKKETGDDLPDWFQLKLRILSGAAAKLGEHPKLCNFVQDNPNLSKAEMIQIVKEITDEAQKELERTIELQHADLPATSDAMLAYSIEEFCRQREIVRKAPSS